MRTGSYREFREHLDRFTTEIDGKRASTCSHGRSRFSDGCDPFYWTGNSGTTPKWYNRRTIAYLAAYVDWAGAEFGMDGLVVDDGFVKPDRAVMCSLLDGDFVRHRGSVFGLTEKGAALIAPFVILESMS